MKYLNYCNCDLVNGNGMRCVVWVSGCSHNCAGCFSQGTHDPKKGTEFTKDFLDKLLNDLSQPFITGLTWTGGDPLHKRNVEVVTAVSRLVKATMPEKDIWLYTGYTAAQIKADPLRAPVLEVIDYLIDGKYEQDLPKAQFRGSNNQVIYHIKDCQLEIDPRYSVDTEE